MDHLCTESALLRTGRRAHDIVRKVETRIGRTRLFEVNELLQNLSQRDTAP